jgi:hypothetical protein
LFCLNVESGFDEHQLIVCMKSKKTKDQTRDSASFFCLGF